MSGKIYAAMATIMKETDAIGKDQKNQAQKFNYRGIDDVYNAMHSVLARHGVFMTPEVLDKSREERINKNGTVLAFTTLRIKYTFYAEDGSNVSCIVEGEGMDSGDKSSNKAMAVAHKYAMLQTFCIPTAEQKDPDAEVHAVAPRQRSNGASSQQGSKPEEKSPLAVVGAEISRLIGGAKDADAVSKVLVFYEAEIAGMKKEWRDKIHGLAEAKRQELTPAAVNG